MAEIILLVVWLTFCTGSGFVFLKRHADRRNNVLNSMPKGKPKPLRISKRDIYLCQVYETRLFERKLVDAGILKASEMTVCDRDDCENCQPSRPVPPKRTDKGIHYCVYCSYVGKNFDGVYLCDFHYERKQSQKKEEYEIHSGDGQVVKTYINYRPETENRMVKFGKYQIVRPDAVPPEAKPYYVENNHALRFAEILWKWDTYKHGEPHGTMAYKQLVTNQMFAHWQISDKADFMELADEPVCRDEAAHQLTGDCGCWVCVYDPDTGDHLGDYLKKADGEFELRSPKPRSDNNLQIQVPKFTTSTGPR